MSDTLPRTLPRSVSGSLSSSLSGSLPNSLSSSLGSATQSGNRFPQLRLESPFPAMWVGFFVFVAWTMIVLASASSPGELAAQTASVTLDQAVAGVDPKGDAWSGQVMVRSRSVSVLLLFGSSLLLGWVWLLTAGLAYVVRTDGIAARAFARWAALVATLLITICDFHTSRRLLPAYFLAYALMQSALLEFVLFFPVRVPILVRWPWLHGMLRGMDGVLLVLVVGALSLDGPWGVLCRHAVEDSAPIISGLALAAIIWRVIRLRQRRRAQAIFGAVAVLPMHLLFAVTVRMPQLCGPPLLMLALPVGLLCALCLIVAMVRHDLWDSELVVPGTGLRTLVIAILSFMGGLWAVMVWRLMAGLPLPVQIVLLLTVISVAGPAHGFFGSWLTARLFPAEALYRTTVDELIVRFTDLRTRLSVIETVEKTVTTVCACSRAKLVAVSSPRRVRHRDGAMENGPSSRPEGPPSAPLDPGQSSNVPLLAIADTGAESGRTLFRLTQRAIRRALRGAGVDNLRPEQIDALCNGNLVFVESERSIRKSSPGLWAWLLVPVRFREQVIGVLVVSPKLRGKLFTSLDQELLLTIAHQAALALANAIALEELDELRRAEHSAHRERLDRAISTIAAEIAHEIRFPINFFRMLVERQERTLHQGKPLSETDWAEDLDIGREEVSRLERMADRLRKMALSRTVQPRPVSLRSVADHVRLLLADRLIRHSLKMEMQDGIEVLADPDALIQVLLNLLANAIDASPPDGSVGLHAVIDLEGVLRLVVWDEGPGFSAPVAKIFEPWFTTKAQGTGLGLAITHRLVRAHGWEIVAERRGDRTCFDVVIPFGEWRQYSTAEISLLEAVSSEDKA